MFTGENIVIAGWVSSWALSKDTGREMSCSCDGSTGVVQDRVEFVRCWWRVSLEFRRCDAFLNPKGIPPKAQGLRAARYPGFDAIERTYPNGVVACPARARRKPVGVETNSGPVPKVASRTRQPLGCKTQSRWDWPDSFSSLSEL